jgi:hypothetical protein
MPTSNEIKQENLLKSCLRQKSLPDFSQVNQFEAHHLNEQIKQLCLEFNPFNFDDSDLNKYEFLLETLDLKEKLNNPYAFTNELLQMLDLLDQMLKQKTH